MSERRAPCRFCGCLAPLDAPCPRPGCGWWNRSERAPLRLDSAAVCLPPWERQRRRRLLRKAKRGDPGAQAQLAEQYRCAVWG